MPAFEYTNPGSAAADAITQLLAQRRVQAQQDLMNSIALRRESLAEKQQQFMEQQRQDALKEVARQHDILRAENVAKGMQGRTGQDVDQPTQDLLNNQGMGYMLTKSAAAPPIPEVALTGAPLTGPASQPNPDFMGPQEPGAVPTGGAAEVLPKTRTTVAPSTGELNTKKMMDALKGVTDPAEVSRIVLGSEGATPAMRDAAISSMTRMQTAGDTNDLRRELANQNEQLRRDLAAETDSRTRDIASARQAAGGNGEQAILRVMPDGSVVQIGSMHKGDRITSVPGATDEARRSSSMQTGVTAIDRLDSDITKADSMGLLGPASGRWYQMLAKAGTTGDPEKDDMIGRIKGDILLAKMHVDAGIGGTRAASSPLLLKNWEDIAITGSASLLKGYTRAIRDDMGASGAKSAGAAAATSGGSKRVYYDADGNPK